ncbi:hypothetical protein [Acidipropionibacterium virtanenii]|uniref:Uncharacterized protein n=1 Tax=Acidipropionibacterium virtanenii TaxID=2057246 RepID=A0A344UTT8_9ACTN|nr:hypothetical protein [Acidipropionibacterium virtanenii]AXE38686.1 hypothetical protein JS278_01522 [Acidipropionibacterium virtanenii]
MSFQAVMGTAARRWYVVVAAVLCALGVGYMWMRDGGCYSAATTVSFTLPARSALLPESGREDGSVIAFAGAVAGEINQGREPATYASDDAPLYGVGVRQGVLVAMPNSGGQWSSMYARADIEIQVVGRSREWVEMTRRATIQKVLAVSRERQVSAYSDPQRFIVPTVMPLTSGIQHVTVSRTEQLLAFCALVSAGMLVGTSGAVMLDRAWARYRTAQRRPAQYRTAQNRSDDGRPSA